MYEHVSYTHSNRTVICKNFDRADTIDLQHQKYSIPYLQILELYSVHISHMVCFREVLDVEFFNWICEKDPIAIYVCT